MELADAFRRRRMVRNFTTAPISAVALDRVVASAFRAPAAGNTAALDLVVLTGTQTERYWSTTFTPAARSSFRWQGLFLAPALVIVVVDPDAYPARYAEDDKARTALGGAADAWPVPYWWVDAGMAAEHVLLAALDEDLGACFFGLFDHEDAVRSVLGIPVGRRLVGTIAVGHPAPDEPGRSAARARPARIHPGAW